MKKFAGKVVIFAAVAAMVLGLGLTAGLIAPSVTEANDVSFCTVTGNYTVCTDKDDYAPGDTAHISGSGFAPGTSLTIKVTRPDGSVVTGDGSFAPWPTDYDTVVVDTGGGFQYDYILDGITGEYLVEVLDGDGNVLASHTFMDWRRIAWVKLNDGTAWTPPSPSSNGAPVTVAPGASIKVTLQVRINRNYWWYSTEWLIEGGSWMCADHANHKSDSSMTVRVYEETFYITAPSSPGTYDLTIDAHDQDGCEDWNGSYTSDPLTLTDAIVVEEPLPTWYRDADGDGYGNPEDSVQAATQPDGYVADNTDCDDTDNTVYPGALEVCDDGIDNDCDGLIDCADPDCPADVEVQMAMILDGSGSMDEEWDTVIDGLADAVESADCVPQDCTVELTVVQFGDGMARLEVGPVVITPANAATVANQIRAISQIRGYTPLACGIYLAADTLFASPNFNTDIKQALNLVTDGVPNRCCDGYTGYYCTEAAAKASAVVARNYLLGKLQMTENQDEFDAEGIGITDANRDWLKNNIIFPATGYSSPPGTWPPPGPGWVRVVADANEFAATICEKFQVIIEPASKTFNLSITGCEPEGVVYTVSLAGGDYQDMGTPPSYTYTGLIVGQTYSYSIKADGTEILSGTTEALVAGENVNNLSYEWPCASKTFNLSITGCEPDGVVYEVSLDGGDYQDMGTPPSYTFTGLIVGQTYGYSIKADGTEILSGTTEALVAGENVNNLSYNWPCASITIIKDADPSDGTDFDFTGNLGDFTLDDAVPDDGDLVSSSKSFTDLVPGTYVITESALAGWDLTDISCSGDATVKFGDGTTFPHTSFVAGDTSVEITLGAGDSSTCTFTNTKQTCTITGHKYGCDESGNCTVVGIKDWAIYLEKPADNVIATTTTDGDGYYEFTDLPPGDYTVTEELPAGWEPCTDTSVDVTLGAGQNTVVSSDTDTEYWDEGTSSWKSSVAAWEPSAWGPIDYDFSTSGADWVWESEYVDEPVNGDVVEFKHEFYIPGTPTAGTLYITVDNGYEVYLNGSLVGSAQVHDYNGTPWEDSDLSEPYVNTSDWSTVEDYDVFTYLVPGTNVLKIKAANEYMGQLDGQEDGTIESNPAGVIYELTYDYDCHFNVDFCNYEIPFNSSISGYKWADCNENTIKDPDEFGLIGWEIKLYKDEVYQESRTTGPDGAYSFTGLQAGTYTVKEIVQDDWFQTYPSGEGHNITLGEDEDMTDVNFGNHSTGGRICANEVVSVAQGTALGGGSVAPERSDPNSALGLPDEDGTLGTFFSLGYDGAIVLGFAHPLSDNITVWETTWGTGPLETADVYVSQDNSSWTKLGEASNNGGTPGVNAYPTTFPLSSPIQYVRIVNTTDPGSGSGDAFDVQAVCGIYACEGSITIEKVTDPAGGTGFDFSGDLGDFTLNDSDSAVFSDLVAGDYDVTETVPEDWNLDSIVCTGGDCTAITDGVTIHLYPGEDITVTFTDTQKGTIIIEKVTDPSGGTGFGFTDNIKSPNSFSLDDGGSKTFTNVEPGSYTVTEGDPMVTPGGYNLTNLVCVDSDAGGTASTANLASRQATINLDPGETVTCTFTNEEQVIPFSSLTVIKLVINDDGDTADPEDFTITVTGNNPNPASFPGSATGTLVTLDAGDYSISEIGPDGYTATFSDDCTGTITPGGVKTCTITNDDVPAVGCSIGDTVFYDNNGNRTQDSGEPGILGVQLNLYLDDGNLVFNPSGGTDVLVRSDTTDSGGKYEFTGLDCTEAYWVDVVDSPLLSGLTLTTGSDPWGPISFPEAQAQGYNDADFGYRPAQLPPRGVGGEAYPVNKLAILMPWIALFAGIPVCAVVLTRRRAQS